MNDTYIGEIETLADSFRYSLCEECHGDLDEHTIGRDILGNAHLYCTKEPS
jgi:hypothetical protein